jgi:hypothetical protein
MLILAHVAGEGAYQALLHPQNHACLPLNLLRISRHVRKCSIKSSHGHRPNPQLSSCSTP